MRFLYFIQTGKTVIPVDDRLWICNVIPKETTKKAIQRDILKNISHTSIWILKNVQIIQETQEKENKKFKAEKKLEWKT